MGPDAIIFVFWMLSFKPTFSLSSFTFIKMLFSFSSLSARRVVSPAYLRLLTFLLAILMPAYVSSSLEFLKLYTAYKLNKQSDNIQLWHAPFPIWNQSVVPCFFLAVASWPAYRFLRRQVSEKVKVKVCSVMSDSLWPHGLYSPWNSPGQNTGVGSYSLLWRIFPTQGSNPGLPHYRCILYHLSHQGNPVILEWVAYPFSSRSSQPRNWTGAFCIAGRFFTSWATGEDGIPISLKIFHSFLWSTQSKVLV